jgi:hypothetical protein
MGEFDNDKEEDPRMIRSWELSPRARKEYEPWAFERPEPLIPPDNVYAESKPPNPLGNVGKTFSDEGT